tara:strand:+ start:9397 stop:9708 length:312 start_codon:yes stop_codon:yes gene_type:complete
MRWYDNYFRTTRQVTLMEYLLSQMTDTTMHTELMESALDEVSPKPEPKKPEFKVISTKTVRRNNKVFRVTVEELTAEEVSEDSETVSTDESQDFDDDMKEDLA